MEGILRIIQSISEADSAALPTFLHALEEHQSFRLNPTDAIVTHITTLLNKHATRPHGLQLLDIFLEQCTLDIVSQKGQLWVTLCVKTCNQKAPPTSVNLAWNCIALLIKKSTDVPDLSKAFSSNLLAKMFETLSYIKSESHLAALKCIEISLRIYPGACGTFRNTIEKFVSSFIDSTDPSLVLWAGKCFHLLQQVKGAGNTGINQKAAWQLYYLKIIGSLHGLIDIFFSNFPDTYDEEFETQKLNVSPLDLSSEPVQRSSQLLLRFKNLIKFLKVALGDPFPTPKAIVPKKIIQLIGRGLSVNCIMAEKNPISDNLAIGALLPELHTELFKLLDVLVLTLKTHLAVYSKFILRFIADTLKWTSSGKYDGLQKPYRSLRIAAYNSLSLWCSIMKCGSLCEVVCESLIEQIKYDCTPFHAEVTLKVLSGAKKHMSKKARRLLHKAQNEKSNIVQTHSKTFNPHNSRNMYSDEGNAELCCAALKCLKNIILSSFCFMKPTTIRDVQEKMFTLCSQLSEESSQKEKLYWNSFCRESLYDVIYTLVISPHHLCPPPAQLAVTLLEMGQHLDKSQAVRNSCFKHLRNIEKIIHPQKECLYFPPDIASMKTAFKKYKEKPSELSESDSSSDENNDTANDSNKKEHVNETSDQNVSEEHEDRFDSSESNKLPAENRPKVDSLYKGAYEEVREIEEMETNESSQSVALESGGLEENSELETITLKDNEDIEKPAEDKTLGEQCAEYPNVEVKNIADHLNEDDLIELEPRAKKSRLEENIKTDNLNEVEDDSEMLGSILTTFVDELNQNE